MNSSDMREQSRGLTQLPAASVLVQYLAPCSGLTLALLVIHLHEQVQRLGLLSFIEEASRVHLPLDGGVPVILHSIVSPAEKAEGNRSHHLHQLYSTATSSYMLSSHVP